MKRYIRADANYFTIKGWVNTPYPYPADVDYVVIEHTNGTAGLEWGDETIYALIDKQVQLFS